jgi:hypothetical protein
MTEVGLTLKLARTLFRDEQRRRLTRPEVKLMKHIAFCPDSGRELRQDNDVYVYITIHNVNTLLPCCLGSTSLEVEVRGSTIVHHSWRLYQNLVVQANPRHREPPGALYST